MDASLRPVTVRAAAATAYATTIESGRHTIRADEPTDAGGTDTGPTPIQLLLAALASCTIITVRMYAARKGWEVGGLSAEVEGMIDRASRLASAQVRLHFTGALDDAQRTRLLEIAAKCPVHRALAPGVSIQIRAA